MEGFFEFCSKWYFLFWILAFLLGIGICGYIIDKNADVIETDRKKKELLEKSRDMSVIKTQFKDKTLALSGLEDAPAGAQEGVETLGEEAPAQGAEEDLNAPLNLNL